ncbi:MAG TPA: hypothetical protein VN690_05230 [Terriglobales bacterium]|nr:hypothetical protein [Terriglobales bacterium]
MTPRERREALEQQLNGQHDWVGEQVWGWEACGVRCPESCSICGMRHTSYSGGQDSPDHDTYEDADGESLTLAQAVARGCV